MLLNIPPRPNRLEEEKDEDYHLRYARWCIGNYNLYSHQNFVSRYLTNVAFYKGQQWIYDEDIETFLLDESGSPRNRIKWIHNIIKPFVEYYRGSAVKMDLNSEVVSISRESQNRRDMALDKMLYWTKVAKQMAKDGNVQGAQQIREQYPIGETEKETKELFNNTYIDEYVKKINYLLKYISEVRNDVPSLRMKIAEDLALAGIGILKENDRNGEQVWTRVAPERFIFDMTCEDISKDAEFMGEFWMRSAVDLYEEFQSLTPEKREAIENSSMTNIIGLHNVISFYTNYAQKLPTYEMNWRDVEVTEHGAFYDDYGYPILQEIDKKKYTKEKLIPVEELEIFKDDYSWIKTVLNDGSEKVKINKKKIATDVVRFCKFIPSEFINGQENIVLDYGIRDYTAKYSYRHDILDFPYKTGTYSYILGEILSPVDALISPQRFLNRVMSAAESRINNARGSGTIIDRDIIDAQDGEEGLLRKMNASEPIVVNAQRQLNNSIGQYGSTIDNGTISLFSIADNMKNIANDIFGGGQQIMGQGGAYRVTGSVANQNLSQGVTMQEPFFYAIERIYIQAYNSMVTRGKRIYTANQRQLALEVGDDGVVIFNLSKEFDIEDFRCKVIRAADQYTQKETANQMLTQFLQMGLIDDKTYAAYFNNSTMMDVAYALREYTGLKVQAQINQARANEKVNEISIAQQLAANNADALSLEDRSNMEYAMNQENNQSKENQKMIDAQSRIISSAISAESKKEAANKQKS